MARTNQRGSKNNNPEGRNQFSNGWVDSARDRPVAAAAAAAAAVGAGVFLWSRRNQISDQISNLSDQFSEWAGGQQFSGTQSGNSSDLEFADAGTASVSTNSTTSTGKSGGRSSRGKSGQGFGGTTGSGAATANRGGTTGSGGTAF